MVEAAISGPHCVPSCVMNIWMPIYEHSPDLRSEIITIKKFPFPVLVSIELDTC